MGYIQALAEHWNSGFIFDGEFAKSKQFRRYCSKIENTTQEFLKNAIEDYNEDMTAESLCGLTWSFFVNVVANDSEVNNRGDWRFILMPLIRCSSWCFNKADTVIQSGWGLVLEDEEGYQKEVYEPCMTVACMQYLHSVYIKNKDIDKSNFCVKALPEKLEDVMLFVKLLLNVIWTYVYSNITWAQQDRAKDALQNVELTKENTRLLALIAEMKVKLTEYNDVTVPFYEKKIAEMKRTQSENCQREVSEYKAQFDSEFAAMRKKTKQLEEEVTRLKDKNRELTEQLEILDEVEDDDKENTPTVDLNYNSKIIFIASSPSNGRIEGTYKRLMQKFPNSRMVYSADDVSPDADCYVMLTRYMKHHSLYNSTRDLLLRRNYPYIHSSNQNVDRIAHDIFFKTRYFANQ